MNDKFPLLLVVFLILVLIGTICAYFIFFRKKETLNEEEIKLKTAQDFTNVKDIKDCFLFTNDDLVFTYLEVQPISMEMLSDSEKQLITKNITSALSVEKKPFKTLSFPKEIDLSFLIYKYENMYKVASTETEKKLIRLEINKMKEIMFEKASNEFKFYFILWEKSEDTSLLLKRSKDFIQRFEENKIKVNLINEKEIYRLCNLVNNPTNFDNGIYERTFPIISEM